MAVTNQGIASWGVTGNATGVTGVIVNIGDADEPIMSPEHNEIGQVIKQTHYDTHYSGSFTVEVAAGTQKPGDGAQVSINGKNMYVVHAEVLEDNGSYRRIQIRAEAYKKCNQVTVVN